MRTLLVILMVVGECCRANDLLEVNEITKANVDKLLSTKAGPDVYFAVQIDGFNSSSLISGPLVFQDKRTIFISDLRYGGKKKSLTYWTGLASPDRDRNLISEKPFEGNHTNIYLSLSSEFTLDNITFLGVGEGEILLTYVILTNVNKSLIREDRKSIDNKPIYTIPKCCPQQQLIYPESGCGPISESFEWNVTIFESNVTGLDPDIVLEAAHYELNPYHYKPMCDDGKLIGMTSSEIYGLIYNASLIIKGEGIKAHHQFCVDKSYDSVKKVQETMTIVCYTVNEQVSNLYLYLPDVILSTICFAITAIMYSLILKENIILKKCVISFSSSMCIAFISLIVMNVQNNVSACHIFGFSFLTTTVFSFLWLPVSFFELFYLVIRPDHLQKDFRWNYYIGVTSAISVLILAVSLFSGTSYVPDIPNTFIRHPSSCQYMVEYERVFILFAPMIMSVAASGVLMFIITSRIRKNYSQEEIRNTYYWIQNGNHYTFMYRTYGFILLATLFWFAHLFYDKNVTQLPLDVLEAALGIITLAALVLNKYTRKEIYYYFKPAPPPEALNLGDLNTPNSPEREQEPFFSNNHAANANQPNR